MWQAGQIPIPGYKLEKFVGRGNFGEVWQASSPGGTKCALKFLNLRERQGRKELRAIQRLKQIRHANLMPFNAMWLLDDQQQIIPDDQFDPSHPFMEETHRQTLISRPEVPEEDKPKTLVIAMPLAEINLLQLSDIRRRQHQDIPIKDLLIYMMDAARALDFLNAQRHEYAGQIVSVQHGDVKPENLVLVGGSVMLCDFGVARTLGAGTEQRGTSLGGSLAYMAPECMTGQVSPHSDQFSLAISYAELRTGQLPFADESITQLIEDRKHGQLDLEGLTPAEQKVVRRACAVNPDKRFNSNVEFVEALRSALLEPHRQRQSGWSLATGMLAVITCLTILAALFWWPLGAAPKSSPANVSHSGGTSPSDPLAVDPVEARPNPIEPLATQSQPSPRELYREALEVLARSSGRDAQFATAVDRYSAAVKAGFPLETPAPQRWGVQPPPEKEVYSIAELQRVSQLVATDPRSNRALAIAEDGQQLLEMSSNSTRYDFGLATPLAALHWLDDQQLLVQDCQAQLWRLKLSTGTKELIASGVLQVVSRPSAGGSSTASTGLAASDGDGQGPSVLITIGSDAVIQTEVDNLVSPLLALSPSAQWGVWLEEFEHEGTVRLLPIDTAATQAARPSLAAVNTGIEAYCATCVRLGVTEFAIVGGKSSQHPAGLAILRLPANSSDGELTAETLSFPKSDDDSAHFAAGQSAVRSLATHVLSEASAAWVATGQNVSSGSPATQLWRLEQDGSLMHAGTIGQQVVGDSISALSFDPTGEWLVRGTSFGEVLLTQLEHPQLDFALMSADYAAEVVRVQFAGKQLIVTFVDASILVWDFQQLRMVYAACRNLEKSLPTPVVTRPHSA